MVEGWGSAYIDVGKPWGTSTSTPSGFIGSKSSVSPPFRVTPLPLFICIFHRGLISLFTAQWIMLGGEENPTSLGTYPTIPIFAYQIFNSFARRRGRDLNPRGGGPTGLADRRPYHFVPCSNIVLGQLGIVFIPIT